MLIYFVLISLLSLCTLSERLIEDAVTCATLVPVATAIEVCAFLLVPCVDVVCLAPLVRTTALCKTPRDTTHLCLTELLKVKLTGTLVHDVTDSYCCIHLLCVSATAHSVHILSCTSSIALIEACLGT